MSKKFSPTIVGIFVMMACAILFFSGAVLLNGRFFKQTASFVLYFNSSMNGLDIGSPVKFKGVRIGTVKAIDIAYDQVTGVVLTPLIIEINSSVFSPSAEKFSAIQCEEFYKKQIMSGLAAKLALESLITGKLFVELDYYPPNKMRFYGKNETKLTQIPTVRSEIEKFFASTDNLLKKIGNIDFATLSRRAVSILSNLDEQISKTDLQELVHNISNAAVGVRNFIDSEKMRILVDRAIAFVNKLSAFFESLTASVDKVEKDISVTVQDIRKAADSFRGTCEDFTALVGPQSDLRQNAKDFLLQGVRATRSLCHLLDLLNKTPNAVLTGVSYE